jgi:hypothetical protein
MCTICLAGVFEDGSEQKCHEERSSVQDRGHRLKSETGLYGRSPDRSARVGNLCENGDYILQDKKLYVLVLFFCKCAEVCELRMRYRDLFEGMFKTLHAFAPSSSEFFTFLGLSSH